MPSKIFSTTCCYANKTEIDGRILFVSFKSLKTIDIRKVFNEFYNLNDEHNRFSNNNNPSDSLLF
jgi:hypothetical protein